MFKQKALKILANFSLLWWGLKWGASYYREKREESELQRYCLTICILLL
uniref:Uncharacterized protein n=1 Tax=Rhizophora mucronata TaxID=61149 RepID=A0A2P2NIZ5_RHIMU